MDPVEQKKEEKMVGQKGNEIKNIEGKTMEN